VVLRLRPEARFDLEAAARWYETQEPGLGRNFLHEVRQAFDRIRSNPEAYASISGRAGLLNARGAVITGARSGSIEKPAAHVLVKHTADQGLVGNALLQGTGTQGA